MKHLFIATTCLLALMLLPLTGGAQKTISGTSAPGYLRVDDMGASTKPKVVVPAMLSLAFRAFRDGNQNNALDGEESATLVLLATNSGKGPAQSVTLTVTTVAAVAGMARVNPISLGTLAPGATRELEIPLSAARNLANGKAKLSFMLTEANGFDSDALPVEIQTFAFRTPSVVVADKQFASQNGGPIAKGQILTLHLLVQNVGQGQAENVKIKFTLPENMFPTETDEFVLGNLAPGASQKVAFGFTFNARYTAPEVRISYTLSERIGGYGSSGTATVPVAQSVAATAGVSLTPATTGTVTIQPATLDPTLATVDDGYGPIGLRLPASATVNPNAVAVLISCEDYATLPDLRVSATNHALMRQYLTEVMGYQPGNILEYKNATLSNFNACFGTATNPMGRLSALVKPGQSEVFIYYSGHGAPDGQSGHGYFVPVDADLNALPQTAYDQAGFYRNLGQLNAASITVMLDACFSGTELLQNVSPVVIKPRQVTLSPGTLVLTASSNDSYAAHFPVKQMGMFTYFVLRAMHDAPKADVNHDKQLTWGEVYDYVSNRSEGVPYYARRINTAVDQVPQLSGDRNRVVFIIK